MSAHETYTDPATGQTIPIWSGAAPSASPPPPPSFSSPPSSPSPPHSSSLPAAFPDALFHLPTGQPLLLTPGREALMHQVFGGERGWLDFPREPWESIALLWFCAHLAEPFPWNALGLDEESGKRLPLYARGHGLNDAARAWLDATCPAAKFSDLAQLSLDLWLGHHAADVIPDPTAPGGEPEKKSAGSPTPPPLINSSGSPPEETSPSATGCSGTCPSGMPSPPATAI